MAKPNEISIWNDTFRFNVIVVWPATDETMRKHLSKHGVNPDGLSKLENGNARSVFCQNNDSFLYFTKDSIARGAVGVAHEAFHVVHDQLHMRGISPIDNSGNEAYAYTLGWLVGEILSKIK